MPVALKAKIAISSFRYFSLQERMGSNSVALTDEAVIRHQSAKPK